MREIHVFFALVVAGAIIVLCALGKAAWVDRLETPLERATNVCLSACGFRGVLTVTTGQCTCR